MQFITQGDLKTLLLLCVVIPLLLAAASIFSTAFPAHIQNQPVLGIPLFLWVWIGVSTLICGLVLFVGSRLSYQTNDDALLELSDTANTVEVTHE